MNNAPSTDPRSENQNGNINEDRRQYDEAVRSVESTLEKLRDCPEAEKQELLKDISQLQDMYNKVSDGRVEIVIFGEISTGKSASCSRIVANNSMPL